MLASLSYNIKQRVLTSNLLRVGDFNLWFLSTIISSEYYLMTGKKSHHIFDAFLLQLCVQERYTIDMSFIIGKLGCLLN